jgi:hypothetical protein
MESIEQKEPQTLEEYFQSKREYWKDIITKLSEKIKDINSVQELMLVVYSYRQNAVDSYYYMLNQLDTQKRTYNIAYANEYNKMKTTAQIRYTSETSINAQIAANMADMIYTTSLMSNHAKYLLDTIKTIDGVIYGIKNYTELEKIKAGGQFNG